MKGNTIFFAMNLMHIIYNDLVTEFKHRLSYGFDLETSFKAYLLNMVFDKNLELPLVFYYNNPEINYSYVFGKLGFKRLCDSHYSIVLFASRYFSFI